MDRRSFLATAAALVTGAKCLGASKVPETPDVRLIRLGKPIGWFDQRPGDHVTAVWVGGLVESWDVTGEPYLNGQGVPTVPMKNSREVGRCYGGAERLFFA